MIFGRKKRAVAEDSDVEEVVDTEEETVSAQEEDAAETTSDDAALWDAEFDRSEGPFDLEEVDLEADEDEVKRVDFGALIATPFPGMTMQLQVNRESGRVQSILVGDGQSGLEVAVFAAPAKSSLVPETRDEIIESTKQQGGKIEVVRGPFGAELRRAQPVKDPQGNPALHVSRTWLVSGPGWLLRGVLMGKATFEPDNAEAQVALFEFFSNLVVRRDSSPAVPGSILPMKVPESAE